MKKAVIILITITYCLFSIGVNLHQHYCSSELAFTEIGAKNNKTCGCDEGASDNCCKDIVKYLKVKDWQQKVNNSCFKNIVPAAIYNHLQFANNIVKQDVGVLKSTFYWPPGSLKTPVFIINRQLLI